MISRDAQPIAHIPPLKPINLRPTYPHVQKEHWEEQIDEMAWAAKVARGERLWRAVVEFAQGRGSVPAPKAVEVDTVEVVVNLPADCFVTVADWTAAEVGSFEFETENGG